MINWIQHFRDRSRISEELVKPVYTLSDIEKNRIGASIAEFERGESSEALDFRQKNAEFAAAHGRPDFETAARLFIDEENFHARMLATYMEQHGIARVKATSADSVFRWLRSRTEVAWSSRVLITAEVLAQVYYPALRKATMDPQLEAICNRIIEDEAYHIEFQTERIRDVEDTLSFFRRSVHRVLHPLLFVGAAYLVWQRHRSVLSYSLNFREYLCQSYAYFRYAMACIGVPKKLDVSQQLGVGAGA